MSQLNPYLTKKANKDRINHSDFRVICFLFLFNITTKDIQNEIVIKKTDYDF